MYYFLSKPPGALAVVLRLEAAKNHLASESLTLHPEACGGGGGPRPGSRVKGARPLGLPPSAWFVSIWPQVPSSAQGLLPGLSGTVCHGCAETPGFSGFRQHPHGPENTPHLLMSTDLGENHLGAILTTLFSFRFLMGNIVWHSSTLEMKNRGHKT